ncbi:MAG: hypothetical protein Q8Q20_05600 [bacterium]|nr:hypothetical protein [bacterium]
MTQKVLRIGSSAGITLSKEALKALQLKIGDQISVQVDVDKQTVKMAPVQSTSAEDDKIAKLTTRFINRYRSDLLALAKK